MPSPLGLLKNNDLALRARSLILRRPRGWGIILYIIGRQKIRKSEVLTARALIFDEAHSADWLKQMTTFVKFETLQGSKVIQL